MITPQVVSETRYIGETMYQNLDISQGQPTGFINGRGDRPYHKEVKLER